MMNEMDALINACDGKDYRIAELEAEIAELEKWHTLYNACTHKRKAERERIVELENELDACSTEGMR